jgi:hypothetical protein
LGDSKYWKTSGTSKGNSQSLLNIAYFSFSDRKKSSLLYRGLQLPNTKLRHCFKHKEVVDKVVEVTLIDDTSAKRAG